MVDFKNIFGFEHKNSFSYSNNYYNYYNDKPFLHMIFEIMTILLKLMTMLIVNLKTDGIFDYKYNAIVILYRF